MKKIKLFEEFVSEVSKQMISGTSGRTITTLDNRKYELKKDVKDARIGDYINVVLPKGTIINNLPGGVFANHKDLKDKYCTGYKAQRWDDKFGVMIRTMPDTLEAIEDNSKVLESMVSEVVELVHVYDTKGELQGTGELVKTKGNKSLIRWDGSSEEWIDSKLVKLVESTINEANEYNREELMNLMETKYKIKTVRTTEEFSGEEGGIWIAGDNGEELGNGKIFDYYNKSSKYKNGVLKVVVDVVEKKGWWFSWNDPGTIMIWPKN